MSEAAPKDTYAAIDEATQFFLAATDAERIALIAAKDIALQTSPAAVLEALATFARAHLALMSRTGVT